MRQEGPKEEFPGGEDGSKVHREAHEVRGGPMRIHLTVRCYAELNDFLAPARRHHDFDMEYDAGGSVKDLLEGLGVPHTEIDLLLMNGEPASFDATVRAGDRVAAYPVFEAFDVGGVTKVRPAPLRETRFVLDVHLGRLAAFLRLAGFDSVYGSNTEDRELIEIAVREHRVILSRDQALLKHGAVTHGSFVHATDPVEQLAEVATRFHLARLARPFTRCMRCNGSLIAARSSAVSDRVPPRSRQRYSHFLECEQCGRVYWKGSHYARLQRLLEQVLKQSGPADR